MRIELDDLSRPAVLALLTEHLARARELSPPGMTFALDPAGLRAPNISFWTAWEDGALCGCGALKELEARHGEVKSMRTASSALRRGTGSVVLSHIIGVARARGYVRLSLETGVHPAYFPAHRLYEKFGFARCGPFADYVENGNSVFMSLPLASGSASTHDFK